MANQPVPSTPPVPQEPLSVRVLNALRGLFQPGTVKTLTIGQEINTGAIRGAITEVTYTIQSAPITIEADPGAAVSLVQEQVKGQIEAARLQAQQAANAARLAAQQPPTQRHP